MRFVLTVLLLTFGAVGNAQDEASDTSSVEGRKSEFLYQSPAGKLELTPNIFLISERHRFKKETYKNNVGLLALGTGVEYGITDRISIGGQLLYGVGADSIDDCPKDTTCRDSRLVNGLSDPEIEAKFNLPVGPGLVRLGTDLSVSVEKSKIKSDGDYNLASGGTNLALSAGYEVPFSGRHVIGGAIRYDVYKGDRSVEDRASNSNYKITGGNEVGLAAFYEFSFAKLTLGTAVIYINTPETKQKVGGTSTTFVGHYDFIGMKFYTPIYFGGDITLLPELSMGRRDYKSHDTIKDSAVAELGCAARFSF